MWNTHNKNTIKVVNENNLVLFEMTLWEGQYDR